MNKQSQSALLPAFVADQAGCKPGTFADKAARAASRQAQARHKRDLIGLVDRSAACPAGQKSSGTQPEVTPPPTTT